ncbi:hypothetical protein [Calycomorphotria hydatis]|nr:hypothetical protein [Calycomorphotria hydatis]
MLYWLSKYGYECAKVDHTGIDIIARDPKSDLLMGVSVKSRSRYSGSEFDSINVPLDGIDKAKFACEAFKCDPYYAFVVDGAGLLYGYLVSLDRMQELVTGSGSKFRYWQMTEKNRELYAVDPQILMFSFETVTDSWCTSGNMEQE